MLQLEIYIQGIDSVWLSVYIENKEGCVAQSANTYIASMRPWVRVLAQAMNRRKGLWGKVQSHSFVILFSNYPQFVEEIDFYVH